MRRRSKFDEARDQRIADEVNRDRYDDRDDLGRRIYCSAHGCRAKASVYFGSALCTWHSAAETVLWPQVTLEVNAMLDANAIPKREEPQSPLTPQDKLDIIARMRAAVGNLIRSDGGIDVRWAHALREREMSGERLSMVQRDAWRSALEGKAIDPDEQLRREDVKRETQRRIDERLEKTA
jgi:hypothetical protein